MAIKYNKKGKKFMGRLGSGLLSDSAKMSEHRKIDCYGVFTIFYAWGYPCSRSWTATITIFELPKGESSINVVLKKKRKIIKSLTSIKVSSGEPNGVSTITIPLKHRFMEPGSYIIECKIDNNKNKLKIPFEVRTKDWPEFTVDEINFAKENPSIPQSLRATVHCEKCEHAYIFEETFLPDMQTKGGVYRFPETGKFICLDCNHTIELRDIQGQLRETLKVMISQKMRASK